MGFASMIEDIQERKKSSIYKKKYRKKRLFRNCSDKYRNKREVKKDRNVGQGRTFTTDNNKVRCPIRCPICGEDFVYLDSLGKHVIDKKDSKHRKYLRQNYEFFPCKW